MFYLPSSALQPLCQYPIIEAKEKHQHIISAPYEVQSIKLNNGYLKILLKANDRQKSFYYFFDLTAKDQAALLRIRRSICKKSGYRQEQEFQIKVADIPAFNKPLTIRILRKTIHGDKVVCEKFLNP